MYRNVRATSVVCGVLALLLFSMGLLPFSTPQSVQAVPLLQFGADDVGVIQGNTGCPSGTIEEIFIHMDTQDGVGSGSFGWVGAITVDGNYNIQYRFCRVPGAAFAGAQGRFAVLSLGSSCPQGSFHYGRHFDNEDNRTKNSFSGDISPSWVQRSGNSLLYFCLFDNTGSNPLPHFGVEYGVFSGQGYAGYVFSNDEDRRNINHYEVGIQGAKTKDPAYPDIIDGRTDTLFYVKQLPA